MNFFAAQDRARRSTLGLVLLFGIAVICLILLTNLLVLYVFAYQQSGPLATDYGAALAQFRWDTFVLVALAVIILVAGGSMFKILQLAGGGRVVAESLGGRILAQNSQDAMHRKVLNVVEEMAIASGLPVPSVYLLDEPGINAFAAGWTPGDAVIGITQGAVQYLSREELQGVIAHEFSHILNGDMRLNVRLTGVLHGILLLGLTGYYLMRSLRHMRSSRGKDGASVVAALFALALGLIVIGYVGTFFGGWIKALVSRQREYLADSSAVQFTRSREGIAGALKKIGGFHAGSQLQSPGAGEFSHGYFAQGVSTFMEPLFSTHPPLKTRILRLDPRWNGNFIAPQPLTPTTDQEHAGAAKDPQARLATAVGIAAAVRPPGEPMDGRGRALSGTGAEMAEVLAPGLSRQTPEQFPVTDALHGLEHIGKISDAQLGYARELLTAIPATLKAETQDTYGARALVYAMVVHPDADVQKRQWDLLLGQDDPGVYRKTELLTPLMATLDRRLRLPLIDLSMPALRELTRPQYDLFKSNLLALMRADNKISLSEWILQRVLLQHLDAAHGLRQRPRAKYSTLGDVKAEAEILLSLVAYAEHRGDDAAAARAFDAGGLVMGVDGLRKIAHQDMSLHNVDTAVDKLGQVKPLVKPRLLKACAACIAADGHITVDGIELLRALASSLDCPMPPVTPRPADAMG